MILYNFCYLNLGHSNLIVIWILLELDDHCVIKGCYPGQKIDCVGSKNMI